MGKMEHYLILGWNELAMKVGDRDEIVNSSVVSVEDMKCGTI